MFISSSTQTRFMNINRLFISLCYHGSLVNISFYPLPRILSPVAANLSLSTCSTSEVEGDKHTISSMESGQEREVTEDAAGEKSGEKKTVKEDKPAASPAEAGFINVHLKMPWVPHTVDVMVSNSFQI